MEINIGDKFIHHSAKNKNPYTVVDFHTTKNMAGEIVKTEWVCQQEIMGQIVKSTQPKNTIIRSFLKHGIQ